MRETKIREKTRELFAAYTELTGYTPVPSVHEFLALREAAIAELKNPLIMITMDEPQVRSVPTVPVRLQSMPQQDHAAGAAQDAYVPIRQTENREEKRTEITAAVQPPAQNVTTESDFDILRRAKDPWN